MDRSAVFLPKSLGSFSLRLDGDAAAALRVLRLCGVHDDPLPLLPKGVCLISVGVDDWFARLSPWAAPPAFGAEPFTGGGPETLSFLTDTLLPLLDESLGSGGQYLLAGYSLAGLFSLWAGYETDRFAAVAGVSPSVWFPGWTDYAAAHTPRARAVYLSLGGREERTRNPAMSTVGSTIRTQKALLERDGVPCVLEWNPGNHFRDAALRTQKGIVWMAKQLT